MHETHLVIKIRPLLPSKDFYLHKEPINILQMNDRRAGTYLVRIYIIQPISPSIQRAKHHTALHYLHQQASDHL